MFLLIFWVGAILTTCYLTNRMFTMCYTIRLFISSFSFTKLSIFFLLVLWLCIFVLFIFSPLDKQALCYSHEMFLRIFSTSKGLSMIFSQHIDISSPHISPSTTPLSSPLLSLSQCLAPSHYLIICRFYLLHPLMYPHIYSKFIAIILVLMFRSLLTHLLSIIHSNPSSTSF